MHIYFIKTGNDNYNSFGILECVCKDGASDEIKTIEDDTGVALEAGLQIRVTFNNGNTHTAPKLLTKTIKGYGFLKPEMFSSLGNKMDLIYDGNEWIITGGIYGENTSSGYTITIHMTGDTQYQDFTSGTLTVDSTSYSISGGIYTVNTTIPGYESFYPSGETIILTANSISMVGDAFKWKDTDHSNFTSTWQTAKTWNLTNNYEIWLEIGCTD